MKSVKKMMFFSIAICSLITFTACRENITNAGGTYNESDSGISGTAYEKEIEITSIGFSHTETEHTSSRQNTEENEITGISVGDYPPVTLESYKINEKNTLTLILHNRMNYDLGYVPIFRLYQNEELIDYRQEFGICGTPDCFQSDAEMELNFYLNDMFGKALNGTFRIEMDFKDYERYFETEELFTLSGIINIEMQTDAEPVPADVSQSETISDAFSVDYEMHYTDNNDIVIRYHNNCGYEVSFGTYYKLYDENGNQVPFNDNAAFNDIAMVMMPGGENELTVYLNEPYFTSLESGNYTVLHELYGLETEVMEIPIIIN